MKFARIAILVFAMAQPLDAFAAIDPLLAAASFAVTGRDSANTYCSDRKNCILEVKSDYNAWSVIESYHFNNIDFSRVSIESFKATPVSPAHAEVSIFGNDVVHGRLSSKSNFPDTSVSEKSHKTFMQTSEIDRLARAWRYVYANGCKSAHSPF